MSKILEILQSHLDAYEEAFNETNNTDFSYKMTKELDILEAKIETVKGIMEDIKKVES